MYKTFGVSAEVGVEFVVVTNVVFDMYAKVFYMSGVGDFINDNILSHNASVAVTDSTGTVIPESVVDSMLIFRPNFLRIRGINICNGIVGVGLKGYFGY